MPRSIEPQLTDPDSTSSEEPSAADDLADFLQRLGRTVEVPKANRLVARARTALHEEETSFNVVHSDGDGLLKRSVNVVAPGVPLPSNADEYDRVYYLTDFLDNTVDAQRLATSVLSDQSIQREREYFIPQHVSSEGEELTRDATEVFRSWLRDDERKLLAVLGPAGYGKTALTCELTHQLAEDYLEKAPGGLEPFPFLVPFGEFRRLASFEGMILSALERQQVLGYTSNAFAYLVAHQRAVLILDGFDELLEERPEEAKQNLRELIETFEGHGKVLLTARSTFFRTSDEVADFLEYDLIRNQVDVVELQPFDTNQRQQLTAKRLESQAEIQKVTRFIESEGVKPAMGSPLLLNETIDALTASDEASRIDVADGRKDLFQALESSVYRRERLRQNHDFSDDEQRSFLVRLADEMLRSNERAYNFELIEVIASEAIDRDVSAINLDHLADHHFLHAPQSDLPASERPVYFNHQVFREYYQASALLSAYEDHQAARSQDLLSRRPLPEEVCFWVAELDKRQKLPGELVTQLKGIRSPAQDFVANVARVCSAYGDAKLLQSFLDVTPIEFPLSLRLTGLDLQEISWSGRFAQELTFIDCDLSKSDFNGASIAELSLHRSDVDGASFIGASVESLSVNYGERIFGAPAVLGQLRRLGASDGVDTAAQEAEIEKSRREELTEIVNGRLRRYYVLGSSGDSAGSRWKGEIQEQNLLGGLGQAERKWVKSQAIPAMVSSGIVQRRSRQGVVLYRLTKAAEDDARALIEDGTVTGLISALIDKLE